MVIRRKEFVSEIKRLQLELARVSQRLSELEELANPTCSLASNVTLVPEGPFDGDENGFATKVAFGMFKSRMTDHH